MEVRNRFEGLDLIDREPDELWNEVRDIIQEIGTKTIPMDCSLPGSSIHGIFQARVLEWVSLPSPSGFPYFLHFESDFGNKEFMI